MEDKMIILIKKPSPEQMMLEDNINKPDLLTDEELMHFGILGMKWGVRRYQNKDGTLTALGKAHLQTLRATNPRKAKKFERDALKNTEILLEQKEKKRKKSLKKAQKTLKKKRYLESDEYKQKVAKQEEKKKRIIIRKQKAKQRKLEAKERKHEEELRLREEKKRVAQENKRREKEARKRKLKNALSISEAEKKKIIKRGPNAVARNIDMFNEYERQKIYNRFRDQESLKQLRSDKGRRIQNDINRIIKYGDSLNNVIKLLNSPAGKTAREFLGLDANKKIFNYDEKYFGGGKSKRNKRHK